MLKKHLPLIIFLSLYFLMIAYKLVSHPTPFYDWDEGINVEVSKESIEEISLVPLWQGKAWLDKPPLPFLLFGTVMKLTHFTTPEISLRIFSTILSLISLILIYAVFYRASRNRLIALLTVIVTAFTPIFLQRSQILNLDVFLLIGWLGYLLFFDNFLLSLLFLTLAVLTKSLIGFYAPAVMLGYYFFLFATREVKKDRCINICLQIFIQVGILSLWYFVMILVYKGAFWQQHIIETHLMRVTASIESHFGQRTYYIDLLFQELGFFAWFSIVGFLVMIWKFFSKELKTNNLISYLFLLPWFIFLNLTKTKIFWYLYPAIPQFAFLAVYPLTLFLSLKKRNNILTTSYYLLATIIVVFLLHQNFVKTDFFKTFYSKPEDYYYLALYAKDRCDSLTVLVDKNTRDSTKTLEGLGLTITSTKQWGDHPSIVYYFGKKVNFIYNKNEIGSLKTDCASINKYDLDFNLKDIKYKLLKSFNSIYLVSSK